MPELDEMPSNHFQLKALFSRAEGMEQTLASYWTCRSLGSAASLNSPISQGGMLSCSVLHPLQWAAEFGSFITKASPAFLATGTAGSPLGSCVMPKCKKLQYLVLLSCYLTLLLRVSKPPALTCGWEMISHMPWAGNSTWLRCWSPAWDF